MLGRAMQQETGACRARELDGLRGWAALMVVLYHLIVESLGTLFPLFKSAPFRAVMDGDLAVSIFFVVSGGALAMPYLRSGRFQDVVPNILHRYFRLTIPILMSCLLVWMLMKLHLVQHTRAASWLHREDWLGSWLQFDPHLLRMLKFALLDVYGSVDGRFSYNPFLWTMSYEMFGSLVIFCLCASHPYIRQPLRVYGAFGMGLVLVGHYIGLFLVGFCLALSRARPEQASHEGVPFIRLGVVAAVLVAAAAGALVAPGPLRHVLTMIEAIAICQLAYRVDLIRHLLSGALSAWLGRVSFAMYWLQFALLVSLYSAGIVYLAEHGQLTAVSGLVLALVVTAACLLLSFLGTLVEERALRAVKRWLGHLLVPKHSPEAGVTR